MQAFRVFSTFTGIGGFEIGMHHAARNVLGEGTTVKFVFGLVGARAHIQPQYRQ